MAFDRHDNLWSGDGTTGRGRVWRITPNGAVTEVFRIQPMRNSTALGGTVAGDGVGRQARTFPPGSTTITVPASPTPSVVTPAGGQDLVANGLVFNRRGDLIVADTARGALWKVEFDAKGNVISRMGCDATFTSNTLCLDNIFVAHPLLEGTDGIALDRAGNIWNAANERNAIVVVTHDRRVIEVFRNPLNAAGLRNSADSALNDKSHSRVPDQSVPERPSVLRGQFRREPTRQFAEQRRRDQLGRADRGAGQDLVPGPAAEHSGLACLAEAGRRRAKAGPNLSPRQARLYRDAVYTEDAWRRCASVSQSASCRAASSGVCP